MSLTTVLIVLAATILFLYLVNTYVFTYAFKSPWVKKIFNPAVVIAVAVVILVLWLLPVMNIHVGR